MMIDFSTEANREALRHAFEALGIDYKDRDKQRAIAIRRAISTMTMETVSPENIIAAINMRGWVGCIYGKGKVGKTTLAMLAPDPFCADIEDGLGWIDGEKKECKSWEDFISLLNEFANSDRKTLVIDTADMLEKHLWEHIMIEHKLKSMKADWHAGYALAAQEWCRLLKIIRNIAAKKSKNFLFTAHQKISTVTNTEGESYEQASINLHKDSAEMFFSQMDFCANAHFETITRKNENKDILAVTSGRRMLNLGCDTLAAQVGNRFGIQGKVPMEASFYNLLGRRN